MDAAKTGHFDLLQKVGEGGMGVVYKARDTRLERVVTIKLVPESRASDAEWRARPSSIRRWRGLRRCIRNLPTRPKSRLFKRMF